MWQKKGELLKPWQKFKTILRSLADSSVPRQRKRHILIHQRGGFLPLILGPLISAGLGALIDHLMI